MNETITLGRLAEMMAASASIDISVAEKFIKAFFAHIEDSLAVSEDVSIDGLGTFFRLSQPDTPISFTPADLLVKVLNEPFEMFTPVAIGNAEFNGEPTTIQEVEDVAIGEPVAEISERLQPEESEVSVTAECDSKILESLTSEVVSTKAPDINDEEVTPSVKEADIESEFDYDIRPSHMGLWLTLVMLIGLVLGGLAGYFGHDKIYNAICVSSVSHDLPPYDSVVSDTKPDVIIENIVDSMPYDTINKVNIPLEVEKSEIYDTVTSQRFLTTMARKYYGQMEYWVFIYDANSDVLRDPNRIKPGTRVRIPDLSDFSENETPVKTLERAKHMGREIYERYH